VIKLDLFGTFLCCRHGIPAIARAGGSSVINMTSNLPLMGIPGRDRSESCWLVAGFEAGAPDPGKSEGSVALARSGHAQSRSRRRLGKVRSSG